MKPLFNFVAAFVLALFAVIVFPFALFGFVFAHVFLKLSGGGK